MPWYLFTVVEKESRSNLRLLNWKTFKLIVPGFRMDYYTEI